MTIKSGVVATALSISMLGCLATPVAMPTADVGQTWSPMDVNLLVGTWAGDAKANEEVSQAGLISAEQGFRIFQVSDALVVTSLFRRTPEAPWESSDTLTYNLDGSTSPTVFHGQSAETKMVKQFDALTLMVVESDPQEGTWVVQGMRMWVDGDRLKVYWPTLGPKGPNATAGRGELESRLLFFDRENLPGESAQNQPTATTAAPEVSVNIESVAQGLTRVTFSPDGLGRSGSLEAKSVSVSYGTDSMTIKAADGTLALPGVPRHTFTTAELTFEKGKYTGASTKTSCCQ